MRTRRFLLPLLAPVTALAGLWTCVVQGPNSSSSSGGSGGSGSSSSSGGSGSGSSGGSTHVTTTSSGTIHCTIDNGADPVGFCTQKLVLKAENDVAFDATRGVARSWDWATLALDQDASHMVRHDPLDDAAFSAAVALFLNSALTYGDNEITSTMRSDLVKLAPMLMAELNPPPAGYAGELYVDLRTTAGGYRFIARNDLADAADAIADAYGRTIHDTYFAALGGGDGGAPDGILGTPAAGGATAYAPGDVATGALALIDMAVRHATDEPAHAAAWQHAAARALGHLDARARDPGTGLYFAALVTSTDPGHDALAPAAASGPPADALLTDVAGRVALALTRAQALVTSNAGALPALASLPLEARAEGLIAALDTTPKSLWDASGGPSVGTGGGGDAGTAGSGYFAGWVPSTAELLTDKPTRANALVMAALHRATIQGAPADGARVVTLRRLFSNTTHPKTSLISVVPGQNGYFLQVPRSFDLAGADAGADSGTDPQRTSYFAQANADGIKALSELWVGLPN